MPVPGGRAELLLKGQALWMICLVQVQAGNVIFRSVRLPRFFAPFSLQDTSGRPLAITLKCLWLIYEQEALPVTTFKFCTPATEQRKASASAN